MVEIEGSEFHISSSGVTIAQDIEAYRCDDKEIKEARAMRIPKLVDIAAKEDSLVVDVPKINQ